MTFCMEHQETIIYRLVTRNHMYHHYFWFFDLWVQVDQKNWHGLGPQSPTKKLTQWRDHLGQQLFQNHVFELLEIISKTKRFRALKVGYGFCGHF